MSETTGVAGNSCEVILRWTEMSRRISQCVCACVCGQFSSRGNRLKVVFLEIVSCFSESVLAVQFEGENLRVGVGVGVLE